MKFNPNDPKHWKDFDPFQKATEFVDGKSERIVNIQASLKNVVKNVSDEARQKMAHKGKDNGFYGKGHFGADNPFYNKTHDDEVKLALAEAAKNRPKSEHCKWCNARVTKQVFSRYHGDLCYKNPKAVVKPKVKYKGYKAHEMSKCPHCDLEAWTRTIERYHLDNCLFKDQYIVSYKNGVPQYEYRSQEAISNDFLWSKVKACADGKANSWKGYTFKWVKK